MSVGAPLRDGRVAAVDEPFEPVWHRVERAHRETDDTVTLTVAPADRTLSAAAPGQFHMLYAVGVGEVPVSVSAVDDDTFSFTIRDVGAVTRALARSSAGAVIGVRGPYGVGWDLESAQGGDVMVVAGGLGLAPLREAVRRIVAGRDRYGAVSLVVGARTPGDLCYRGELADWVAREDLDVAVTVDVADRTWWGSVGVVTKVLPRRSLDPARTTALVCGPEVMMRATAARLVADGIAAERVQLSLERNMRCAVGLCGHCQFGPHLVCRDGPVLTYAGVSDLLGVRER